MSLNNSLNSIKDDIDKKVKIVVVSKTRSKKRRTHYKSSLVHTVKCKNTGVEHLPHHAYYHDGILYYKGKPVDQN